MVIQLIASLTEIESIFSETLVQELSLTLSEFNAMQLSVLIQKHCRTYCSSVAVDTCIYYAKDKAAVSHLSMQASSAEKSFESDFAVFMSRFLSWMPEQISDFLQKLRNILLNTFMEQLQAGTGINIYDDRQYCFGRFEFIQEYVSTGERVLLVEIEPKEIPAIGFPMVV